MRNFPEYGFSEEDIEVIGELIMATKLPKSTEINYRKLFVMLICIILALKIINKFR